MPKIVFTPEYRAEAVKVLLAEGLGVSVAARKSGLWVKKHSKWIGDARSGVLARVDTHRAQAVTDLQAEVSRLKRELAKASRGARYPKTSHRQRCRETAHPRQSVEDDATCAREFTGNCP